MVCGVFSGRGVIVSGSRGDSAEVPVPALTCGDKGGGPLCESVGKVVGVCIRATRTRPETRDPLSGEATGPPDPKPIYNQYK
jgi:hypothetical protein